VATITAANAIFTLSIPAVFPAPQQLQGYAADDAFSTEAVEPAEVMLGVDGIASAAYLPTLTKTIINLQADSPSLFIFDRWKGAQDAAQEIYLATGAIAMPSVGKTFALIAGTLTRIIQFPSVKKILQPSQFEITWQSVIPSIL